MSVTIPDFWKLLIDSRLLSPEHCQQLGQAYGGVKGAAQQGNARTLAEWLIAQNYLSRYQTKILLEGHAGPFFYGDYRVHDRIGKRAQSGTFRAHHVPTVHPVNLRFLSGPAAQNPTLWSRLVSRVRAHCGMVHPQLSRCYELVDLTSFKFLVGEDLQGEPLDKTLEKENRLSPQEACRVIRLAALGLTHLHHHQQVAIDVRPATLWRETGGNIKLLRQPLILPTPLNATSSAEEMHEWLARADYLAPELAQPGKMPDPLTDIYALGCTFYTLLTGRPPFPDGDLNSKLARHATEPIQPLEQLAGIPTPLAQLVAYMMAKNPAVRYQQASIVAEALTPYVEPSQLNIQPDAPPATLPAYEHWIRQKQASLSQQGSIQPAPAISVQGGSPRPAAGPSVAVNTGGPSSGSASPVPKSTATTSVAARRQGGRSKKNNLAVIGVAAALVLLVVIGLFALNTGGTGNTTVAGTGTGTGDPGPGDGDGQGTTDPGDAAMGDSGTDNSGGSSGTDTAMGGDTGMGDNSNPGDGSSTTSDPEPKGPAFTAVADDGELLWAPNTTGQPIELRYVAPGAQVFLVLRPANMLAGDEGMKVMKALGPELDGVIKQWESAAGTRLTDVDQLIIALHDTPGQVPHPAFVVRLNSPTPESDLVSRWGNPSQATEGGERYFTGGNGWAYYIPADGDGRTFAMGAPAEIKEVAVLKGNMPPLRREIERLWRVTDADRHFTLVFAPKYIFGDGQKIFSGAQEKMREPVDWFLQDGIQAAMLSMHFGPQFYAEARLYPELDKQPIELARELKERVQQIPSRVDDYIGQIGLHPYWQKMAIKYSGMIRYLYQQTRIGVENDQAVVNVILPGAAAHNIVAGAELAMVAPAGAAPTGGGDTGSSGTSAPKTLAEILQKKVDLSFGQKSLEFAMQDLAEEHGIKIKIMGPHLQLEGITRNQSIKADIKDKTIAEVLTTLVMGANPVTTVKDPSEVDQKLIWVIAPNPDEPGSGDIILITTRTSAAVQKYNLPDVFKPKG